jgi:hypothetical protein
VRREGGTSGAKAEGGHGEGRGKARPLARPIRAAGDHPRGRRGPSPTRRARGFPAALPSDVTSSEPIEGHAAPPRPDQSSSTSPGQPTASPGARPGYRRRSSDTRRQRLVCPAPRSGPYGSRAPAARSSARAAEHTDPGRSPGRATYPRPRRLPSHRTAHRVEPAERTTTGTSPRRRVIPVDHPCAHAAVPRTTTDIGGRR